MSVAHGRGPGPQVVETDPRLIRAIGLHFEQPSFDVAASRENAQASGYYTEQDNALKRPWPTSGLNWCNPPFSMFKHFTRKAYQESKHSRTLMLAIASISTNWWQDWVHNKARVIPIPRPTFVGHSAPFPKDMALLLYGPDVAAGYSARWDWRTVK